MNYSQRETFFWIKDAALLDQTSVLWLAVDQLDQGQQERFWAGGTPDELRGKLGELAERNYANAIGRAIESNPHEIREYCRIRRSHEVGTSRLIHLLRKELSIDELDTKANEGGQLSSGGVKMNETRYALRIAKVTGNIGDPIVHLAIAEANKRSDTKFFKELGRALELKERPAEIDYLSISIVARFLVDYWCGQKGIYGMWMKWFETADLGCVPGKNGGYLWTRSPSFYFPPPLCFFSNGALATYCAAALQKKQRDQDTSTTAIRKWLSRLGMRRANSPKIREVKLEHDEIWFRL
jgi:hypothetical protein